MVSLTCGIWRTKETNRIETGSSAQRADWCWPEGPGLGAWVAKGDGMKRCNVGTKRYGDVKCSAGNTADSTAIAV